MTATLVFELPKHCQHGVEMAGPQRTGPADLLLVLRQVRGQSSLTQDPHRSRTQFPQIKLLGVAVLEIIIPAGAAIARSQAHRFKAAGSITGSPVFAFIDIAFYQEHRMAPVLLPVSVQPLQSQRQYSGSQIGIALALRQNQKPAVVDHPAQPPGSLAWGPPDLVFAGLSMRSRSTEGEQSHPLAIDFGHVTKALSSYSGAAQIMLLLQQFIKTLALLRCQQADLHSIQELGFGRAVRLCHAPAMPKPQTKV